MKYRITITQVEEAKWRWVLQCGVRRGASRSATYTHWIDARVGLEPTRDEAESSGRDAARRLRQIDIWESQREVIEL